MDRKIALYFFIFCTLLSFSYSAELLSETFRSNINADQQCSSSFECTTGCCYNYICSDRSECKKRMLYAYLSSGVITIIVVILSIIYLFVHIKSTRENVKSIREKMQQTQKEESEKMNLVKQRTTEIEGQEESFSENFIPAT